jgi:hypothetical protein
MPDQLFRLTTRIARPAAEVFAWHERPGALGRLCPPWERVELVSATGGVRDGARVVVRNKIGPFWSEWQVEHRGYVPGREFRDVQLSGPFARWEHLHRIEPDGPSACLLTDEIRYALPGGPLGQALAGSFVRGQLARLFAWRHATTREDLEAGFPGGALVPRRILLAGGSGLVGSALSAFLQTQGHAVVHLVRRPARGPGEVSWNPAAGELPATALDGIDAVVNLGGTNIGAGRWTEHRRASIRQSRLDATRTLVAALARAPRPPAVFVSASAVGVYGERGDDVLDESAPVGDGFLAGVCRDWEAAAQGAPAGVRVVTPRFGVVLSPAGGALAKLLPVFRAGLGGRVGSGRQWMSWISIDDALGVLHHVLLDPRCAGAVNAVAPGAVTNAEFSAVLGRVLGRLAFLPVPAPALRLLFGQMADETLLASTRATPGRLTATGYAFRHPTVTAALRHVLGVPGS